jgi:hypothetical protein
MTAGAAESTKAVVQLRLAENVSHVSTGGEVSFDSLKVIPDP